MSSALIASYSKRSLSFSDKGLFFCVFGRDGVTQNKTEGDWKTPIGIFKIRKIYYRADRVGKMNSSIETIALTRDDAWCDDVNDERYNTFITLPANCSYENLWREDELYDLILVLGYNDSPVVKGKGSAIFIHVAKKDMEYTKGCLALKREDLISLIDVITPETEIIISV